MSLSSWKIGLRSSQPDKSRQLSKETPSDGSSRRHTPRLKSDRSVLFAVRNNAQKKKQLDQINQLNRKRRTITPQINTSTGNLRQAEFFRNNSSQVLKNAIKNQVQIFKRNLRQTKYDHQQEKKKNMQNIKYPLKNTSLNIHNLPHGLYQNFIQLRDMCKDIRKLVLASLESFRQITKSIQMKILFLKQSYQSKLKSYAQQLFNSKIYIEKMNKKIFESASSLSNKYLPPILPSSSILPSKSLIEIQSFPRIFEEQKQQEDLNLRNKKKNVQKSRLYYQQNNQIFEGQNWEGVNKQSLEEVQQLKAVLRKMKKILQKQIQ